jgi:hypothetical protein
MFCKKRSNNFYVGLLAWVLFWGQISNALSQNIDLNSIHSAEMLSIAEQVHTGRFPCGMGSQVIVQVDRKVLGQFILEHKGVSYHVKPIKTSTGAIRLEDEIKGAVWLQLTNKSMLMNSKLGQRLADECRSPAQSAVNEAMKLSPPINILESSTPGLAKK